MAELKNTFSWSFSASQDFEECRRKRYWSKYAMWNGWSNKATKLQKTAYRLNKMQNRYALMGQAVEDAAMWILREKQDGRDAGVDEAYEKIARPFLNRCWKESKGGQWRTSPRPSASFGTRRGTRSPGWRDAPSGWSAPPRAEAAWPRCCPPWSLCSGTSESRPSG